MEDILNEDIELDSTLEPSDHDDITGIMKSKYLLRHGKLILQTITINEKEVQMASLKDAMNAKGLSPLVELVKCLEDVNSEMHFKCALHSDLVYTLDNAVDLDHKEFYIQYLKDRLMDSDLDQTSIKIYLDEINKLDSDDDLTFSARYASLYWANNYPLTSNNIKYGDLFAEHFPLDGPYGCADDENEPTLVFDALSENSDLDIYKEVVEYYNNLLY